MAGHVEVISFGYAHGAPPGGAHIIVDVRAHIQDPVLSPTLRALTGRDRAVVDAVMGAAGTLGLVRATVEQVRALRTASRGGPVMVAVGGVGGRYRSAVVATAVADRLAADGVAAILQHRDINLREVPS